MNRIHSTRLHVVLYSFLLVFTPFILLQNFLVELVSDLSETTLAGVPLMPVTGAVLLGAAGWIWRRRITRRLVVAALVVAVLDLAAQGITDYYFDQKFYDLFQNWHYIAYALFAPMMYRDLAPRRLSLARIIWITYGCALGFSIFDEFFQRQLSNRVFDLSDTAKDALGCLMGLILLAAGGRHGDDLLRGWRVTPGAPPRAHFGNPVVALAFLTAFSFGFLTFTSLLSDAEYAGLAAFLSVGAGVACVGLYFLLLRRWGRIVVGLAAAGVVGVIGIGFARHHGDQIVSQRYGLVIYKGIPIPFFDVMIYPDGRLRLVDRKHAFTPRDQKLMLRQETDIILIGSGAEGRGGHGFPVRSSVQFLHNPYLDRGTEVIILRTPAACELFNRLKQEKKSVLFVVHNTC